MLLSISCLNAEKLSEFVKKVNDSAADYIHVDVMDGEFVKNTNATIAEVERLKRLSKKPLDIHLMVADVIPNILLYRTVEPEFITFHYEATKNIKDIIGLIKSFGIKVGISIKPETDPSVLVPYLKDLDLVLIMSVEPGAGGQAYINSDDKLKFLAKEIISLNKKVIVSIDGGINNKVLETMPIKPDMAVMGSYVSNKTNPVATIDKIKNTFKTTS